MLIIGCGDIGLRIARRRDAGSVRHGVMKPRYSPGSSIWASIRPWLFLRPESGPPRLIYLSTSGVYGDHRGGWVTEASPVKPLTKRASRRLSAERQLQD
jgi:hypothetical protein